MNEVETGRVVGLEKCENGDESAVDDGGGQRPLGGQAPCPPRPQADQCHQGTHRHLSEQILRVRATTEEADVDKTLRNQFCVAILVTMHSFRLKYVKKLIDAKKHTLLTYINTKHIIERILCAIIEKLR